MLKVFSYRIPSKKKMEKVFEIFLEMKVIFLHNTCSLKFSVLTNGFGTFLLFISGERTPKICY